MGRGATTVGEWYVDCLFIARIKDLEKSLNSEEEKFKNHKSEEWSEVR